MRTFKYQDQGGEYTFTEFEILKIYFDYWYRQMLKVNKADEVTIDNCINDWIVVHWAEEIK